MAIPLYTDPPLGDWDEVEDEAVLPAQFHDGPNLTTPERRLWAAVLEDAIGLAIKGGTAEREWFGGEYSFEWICLQLDLDAQAVAKAVREQWERADQGLLSVRRHRQGTGRPRKIASQL